MPKGSISKQSNRRCRCISAPLHQVLDLSISHAPLGPNGKGLTSIYAIHSATKVLVHRLLQVQHGMSWGSNAVAAAAGCRRAGGVPAALAGWLLLWSLAQQAPMCRLSHWRRGWLQIFGIDRKVVAGYGIDGGGADDLLSGNEKNISNIIVTLLLVKLLPQWPWSGGECVVCALPDWALS